MDAPNNEINDAPPVPTVAPPAKPPKPPKQTPSTVATSSEATDKESPDVVSDVSSLKISSSDSTTASTESDAGNSFKPSDKGHKNLSDILAADAGDESLQRYKASLLGSAIHGDTGDKSDPRRLIITEFRVEFSPEEALPPIIHDLSTAEGLSKLNAEGITLREGVKFKFKISFRVQHEIVVGIKFINKMTKMMFSNTEDLALGSYPPSSSTVQVFEFPKWDYNEAPKGMLYRGTYKANNSFVDSDGVTHLKIDYEVHIKK